MGKWQDLDDPARFSGATHPLSVQTIAEQVAQLSLPTDMGGPVNVPPRKGKL